MSYPSFSCYQPDLIVESLEISPASPKSGEKVTFKPVIRNVGGVAAGPVQVTITAANKPGSPMQIPQLDPGAIWTPTRAIHVDGPQTFACEVTVDPAGVVAEGDETNNVRKRTFAVGNP